MYHFLDIFFVVFHTSLVVFNLFGWIWKKTRRINFYTLLLTGASWFILGIFFGIGYCPLTDWHWKVLHQLGVYGLPDSYMKYLADRITGKDLSSKLVDATTLACYLAALMISFQVNFWKQIPQIIKLKRNK